MELTPDERHRIYLEEKARMEIREQLHANAPQTVIVKSQPSDGLAAVLSLLLPGAGQMYKGKVGQGIVWLLFTILGYVMFVIPGVILHISCVFHASSMKAAET